MIPARAVTTVVISQMLMHITFIRNDYNSTNRQSVQMMAVMFLDVLLESFNTKTLGAAKEVGLLLGHNEKTVRTWHRDFYDNQSHFTESKQGKHLRCRRWS